MFIKICFSLKLSNEEAKAEAELYLQVFIEVFDFGGGMQKPKVAKYYKQAAFCLFVSPTDFVWKRRQNYPLIHEALREVLSTSETHFRPILIYKWNKRSLPKKKKNETKGDSPKTIITLKQSEREERDRDTNKFNFGKWPKNNKWKEVLVVGKDPKLVAMWVGLDLEVTNQPKCWMSFTSCLS